MALIKESQLIRIISEVIGSEIRRKPALNESQESESIKGATLLYMERTGRSKEEADRFIRIDLRASFPPLRDKKIGKFILGVTRMFLDGQLSDAMTIANLNTTLKYVGDPTHINEYDRNLNGVSAQELIERFAPARKQDMEKDMAELEKAQYTAKNEYKVVRIDSFEQAEQYGRYNDWCLAQPDGENMYNSYTSDGVNQLYIILRDGFENEPRVAGSNTPYDSYGLSMMTVIVDPYGQMTQSTTRWNHKNGSNDSAFTPKTMSEVIGRNFYEVFRPNTKFKDGLENALKRLRNGENPSVVFNLIGEENEGILPVEFMGKMNYLTKDNRVLMSQWVDDARNFCEGFGCIYVDGKGYNFVNAKGKIISNTWFDNAMDFHEGFATIEVKEKGWNFINTNGEIISNTWSDEAYNFYKGFAQVKLNEKWNFINTKGEYLSNTWFDNAMDFHEGFATIEVKGKGWNFINTKGEYLSNIWFDYASYFYDGFARVKSDGKSNFINTKGEFLSNIWFDTADDFYAGVAIVEKDEKWYFIDEKGNLYDYDDFQKEKKTPVSLNEEAIKEIVKKVLLQSFNENISKNLPMDTLLENYLSEAATLQDIHTKYYPSIPVDVFNKIAHADPTSKPDKMGKYGKWLLNLYTHNKLKTEDLYKATEYLTLFQQNLPKIEVKDINRYADLPCLYDAVKPFYNQENVYVSHADQERRIKSIEAEKLYDDGQYIVIHPKTHAAACYYGKGTQWCTASKNDDSYFNNYNSEGPLYIIINRETGKKWQYHKESNQFMDERDFRVYPKEINAFPEGVKKTIGWNPFPGLNEIISAIQNLNPQISFDDFKYQLEYDDEYTVDVYRHPKMNIYYIETRFANSSYFLFVLSQEGKWKIKGPFVDFLFKDDTNILITFDINDIYTIFDNRLNKIYLYGKSDFSNIYHIIEKWYKILSPSNEMRPDDITIFNLKSYHLLGNFNVFRRQRSDIYMAVKDNLSVYTFYDMSTEHPLQAVKDGKYFWGKFDPAYISTDTRNFEWKEAPYQDGEIRIENGSTEDSLLLEVATSIEPIRNKYASGLTEDDFYRLMSTDPTFNREGDKMGKYWRWILTMYKRGQINPADERSLSEVKECLAMYTKFINRIEQKNIEQIRSVDELKSIIQPFMENPSQATSKTQAIRDIKIKDAIKAYEDDTWYVIIPATMDAAIYYGKNTKWCTSAVKSANKFDEYNDLGNLYIFINRKTGHKYQYFLTRHELKDETNTDVKRIPELTPEAKKFFYNIPAMEESFTEQKDEMVMDKVMGMLSPKGQSMLNDLDSISYSNTGLFPIMKVDDRGREMKNFMDRDGHILSKVWFTEVTPFARGKKYSIVSRGLKQNILFPDGKFALNTWSDGLVDPSDFQTHITDDPIIVYFNGSKNVLNKEDWNLGPYWFNSISEFGPDGTADASFDGHKVKINKNGEVI